MEITIFGTGYVGLVTGTCFAEMGNIVNCLDIDEKKIHSLNKSKMPIYEPGLGEMVARNVNEKRLSFGVLNVNDVELSPLVLIAVGTPQKTNGEASLTYVFDVARKIGENIQEDTTIVTKSTVPVGTGEQVKDIIADSLMERNIDHTFHIVSNPEFLKEGDAIRDFMQPDRIIVGTDNHDAKQTMQKLYAPFTMKQDRLMFMGIREAEMTKYASNAMLATKISFINEMADICDKLGLDVESVRLGIGSDSRIGYSFIYPGCGYGGSCFPKDIKALVHTAKESGAEPILMDAVEARNQIQKNVLFEKINHHFNGNLGGLTIGIWGLAFKPGTDDMREAPSVVLINALLSVGVIVRAFDPVAMSAAECIFDPKWKNNGKLSFVSGSKDALYNADALVLVTEWKMFRNPDFSEIKSQMKQTVIFDGRNQYDPKTMKSLGFHYYGIGRSV